LRAENYFDLYGTIQADRDQMDIGQKVIFPFSFTGGPRYMQQGKQALLLL